MVLYYPVVVLPVQREVIPRLHFDCVRVLDVA